MYLPRSIPLERLTDGDLGQANILHHGPDNGQATGLGRERINLIGALPDITKQAFDGVRAANIAMHDLRKGIERKSNALRLRRDYEALRDSASDTWL